MFTLRKLFKRLGVVAALSGVGTVFLLEMIPKINETRRSKALLSRPKPSPAEVERFSKPLPSRAENLARMSSGQVFDVLVIGGGATGAGVAVDAASRGLSTCLIEKFDFASGTSSRSTKLIHGGVRYLQKAVFNLDIEQFRMVNEALSERANLIDIAPHLAYPLPIMLPVYKLWQLPYFWAGIKMYDVISGGQILKASYYLSKPQVLERFPLLKRDKLIGGLVCHLKPSYPCRTKGLLLEGAHGWSPNLFIQLVQEHGMDVDVAQHLTEVYGDKALVIANMASLTGLRWPILGKRLHPEFPYIEEEIKYACQEYAVRAVDFLARRTRLAFLNAVAAQEALPHVIEIMAKELNWDSRKRKEETQHAQAFLCREMGLGLSALDSAPITLTMEETDQLLQRFRKLDSGAKGYITLSDFERSCKESGERLSKQSLQALLETIDKDRDGRVDVAEFLRFMSALKSGTVAHSPLKRVLTGSVIPVHRSGGGV
ncbi:unnamed protein product [Dicrocoelium dendriticum]|nr:unnamed protein product [Dicrocoelium dendriticum]